MEKIKQPRNLCELNENYVKNRGQGKARQLGQAIRALEYVLKTVLKTVLPEEDNGPVRCQRYKCILKVGGITLIQRQCVLQSALVHEKMTKKRTSE